MIHDVRTSVLWTVELLLMSKEPPEGVQPSVKVPFECLSLEA